MSNGALTGEQELIPSGAKAKRSAAEQDRRC